MSKLPSLGHISFFEMESAYEAQTKILISEGVDCILIATAQDPLQVKAAASGSRRAMKDLGREVPLLVSVTIERNGRMLVGTSLPAMLASIEPYMPDAFGINCALGPDLMEEHLSDLAQISPFPIICQPNAGLPEIRDGKAVYTLGAKDFAKSLSDLAGKLGINIVGGCCGTTPDHISELRKSFDPIKIEPRKINYKPKCASLFNSVELDQQPKPLIIAEQTNSNGSKKFRELVSSKDWDGCVAYAKEAAKGSHVLDIAVSLPGEDEAVYMHELIPRLVRAVDRPLMIDSTSLEAIEAALSHIGGRAIINSINLEDGGKKAKEIVALAKRFGAAIVCLTIDEDGMAKTKEKKLEIAKRLVNFAESEGLRQSDLLIDPLVFTLASGDRESSNAGVETLNAVEKMKSEIPGVNVSLGVSNVSFGLPVRGRKALTSYFLMRAIEKGLDAAIINVQKIIPVDNIDDEIKPWIARIVDNDRESGSPLDEILKILVGKKGQVGKESFSVEKTSPLERLSKKILDGDSSGLDFLISKLLEEFDADYIVNDILMSAMKIVGERFGSGRMPLPFVLQSAETMRSAINVLGPHLASKEMSSRAKIVLATVRGDVHDIGKNLVDAILSNNGFEVINLGIRQPAANVIEAVEKCNADAIGLSGLLVSSTEIMREDMEIFKNHNIDIPILCGGAALTEKFTKEILEPAYGSTVYYCADAFDGLKYMGKIASALRGSK